MGTGVDDRVDNIVIDKNGTMFIFGSFTSAGGKYADQIARWYKDEWFPVGQWDGKGLDCAVYGVAVDKKGDVYAAGDFTHAGFEMIRHIAKWKDGTWNDVGGGIDGRVNGIAVDRNDNLYAWGYFDTAGSTPVPNVAKWDGDSWSPFGDGFRGVDGLVLADDGTIYACGYFEMIDSSRVHKIAMWDGRKWCGLGKGISGENNHVQYMAIDNNGNLYAAGFFDSAGSVPARNIAKWDGKVWSRLGTAEIGPVSSITLDGDDNVYISFDGVDTINNRSIQKIMRWDGVSWNRIGEDFNGSVSAMVVDDNGILYAGGTSDSIGSLRAPHIAMWNGRKWSGVGSGTDAVSVMFKTGGGVLSMVIRNNILYAGGSFTTAGGKASPNFAYCTLGGLVRNANSFTVKEFPSRFTLEPGVERVRLHLNSESLVNVQIYSLIGRTMYRVSEKMSAGEHLLRLPTQRLANGSYIAQVKTGDQSVNWKLVIGR